MELKPSLWGWFTKAGRLKNRWAKALRDTDPARALAQLREVRATFQREPAAYADLWASFSKSFLSAGRLSQITEADFVALEETAAAVARHSGGRVPLEETWVSLVRARAARRELRQARALLVRLYAATRRAETRAYCARELARGGAQGDEHLTLYIDFLRQTKITTQEREIAAIVREAYAADLESDGVRLKRAGETARRLREARLAWPGLDLVLGLHALRVDNDTTRATGFFRAALKAEPGNRTALVGLLSAALRGDEVGVALDVARSIRRPAAEPLPGLILMAETLAWLDDPSRPGPAPATAEQLATVDLALAGETAELALGRLELLAGEAQKARERLVRLADTLPSEPRCRYYAAWAALLTGDRAAVERQYQRAEKWPRRWVVGALLYDAHPARARDLGVEKELLVGAGAFCDQNRARVSLARAATLERFTWDLEKGTLEERLETLRTACGVAVAGGDSARSAQLLALPLFGRLPLADQLLWRGVTTLQTERPAARELLRQAQRLGHERAGLILATHLLHTGQPSEAKTLLAQFAHRQDDKLELLRAYLDVREGQEERAATRLEELVTRGEARAHYALGNLYLQRSAAAARAQRAEQSQLYRKQAAGAYRAATATKGAALPRDAHVLMLCAEAATSGTTRAAAERIIEVTQGWRGVDEHPWLAWHIALARLERGDAPTAAAAGGALLALICLSSGEVPEGVGLAVAGALVDPTLKLQQVQKATESSWILEQLAGRFPSEATRRYAELGIAAATRLRSVEMLREDPRAGRELARTAARDKPSLGLLALVAAELWSTEDRRAAEALLREARPGTELESRLCAALAALLAERAPALDHVPALPASAPAPLAAACELLAAAAAFGLGDHGRGYNGLLGALKRSPAAVAVRLDRFLPTLCAPFVRGGAAPEALRLAVRNLGNGDGVDAVLAARCASAVGETEAACRYWEAAVAADETGAVRREYASYLCHLAAASSGLESVERLRQALECRLDPSQRKARPTPRKASDTDAARPAPAARNDAVVTDAVEEEEGDPIRRALGLFESGETARALEIVEGLPPADIDVARNKERQRLVQCLVRHGDALAGRGRLADAAALAHSALRVVPQHADVTRLLGEVERDRQRQGGRS